MSQLAVFNLIHVVRVLHTVLPPVILVIIFYLLHQHFPISAKLFTVPIDLLMTPSSSGSSLDSAPMSESEGGQSPRSNASDAIFPIEGKFHSEKDRAHIMSLPEIEREAILAERADIIQRKTQDQILRKLYEGYTAKEGEKNKAVEQKKRKAGTAELEDVQRKSSRQKTTLGGRKVGETSDAMEAYKRQREQKGIMAEQRKHEAAERKARKGQGSVSGGSEADADGESEVEWDDPKQRRRSVSGPRDELLAELIDYEHVRVGRDNFAKYCFYPGFEQAMKNCYVRLAIGPDKTGENVYRMCEIKGALVPVSCSLQLLILVRIY
jgi:RNA polymerase-associated protein RTF1